MSSSSSFLVRELPTCFQYVHGPSRCGRQRQTISFLNLHKCRQQSSSFDNGLKRKTFVLRANEEDKDESINQLKIKEEEELTFDRPLDIYGNDNMGPSMFGLEPKQELDSLDNGLTFIGPMVLAASLYIIALPFLEQPLPPPAP